MLKHELEELIRNGESSGDEFKRDNVRPDSLANILIESRGMGVREKIIAGMLAHNGTEPDLIEEETRFTVRLWKEKHA